VDDTEELKARKQKWEEGQVVRAESLSVKANVEGYKVEDTEELKARKKKWEEGQVTRADSFKANVEGYKVDDTEELKARKKKWEEGQVTGAAGATVGSAEGYKLTESAGVKDRMNKWSQVTSAVPTIVSPKKLVSLVPEGGEPEVAATVPAGTPAGVKDRMNKWSEVTKEPEPAARKEPLKIYDDQQQQ